MVHFQTILIFRMSIIAIRIANGQYSELSPFAGNTERSALMVFQVVTIDKWVRITNQK